ncbi:MAG: alpha/beta fold hydrolase [Betaproteobacteria bacterium]|nr:alpha/beta fold hydrolase [Betaproteobacteria bacterium]
MATFLVAHGAWSAAWAWKKMRPRLRERGHELLTPTYTGLGERAHLARPEVGLNTHIEDLLAVLAMEDLRELILVGHSYGGMVATSVADRAAERIAQLVYLDAFVPRDGQSLFDLQSTEVRASMREAARRAGEGWRIPPNPPPPDTSPEDIVWVTPRRFMHPLKAFEQVVRLGGAVDRLPRTYIYCTRSSPGDVFGQFAHRARSEPGWRYLEIDASHNPHITVPDALAAMLDAIATSA